MRDEDHGAVRIQTDEEVRAPSSAIYGFLQLSAVGCTRENLSAEDQRARGEYLLKKATAGDNSNAVHALTPAACLMALRIRWYVPQRQILPCINSSISRSVGFGFCCKSATACIIWPAWQ